MTDAYPRSRRSRRGRGLAGHEPGTGATAVAVDGDVSKAWSRKPFTGTDRAAE